MEDLLNALESLMKRVRNNNNGTFPVLFMNRAARIAHEILTNNPNDLYCWEDIRRDFQPRNADPFDPINLETAQVVALHNVDYWISANGGDVNNIRLASSLSSLIYLHRVNPTYASNKTHPLMKDVQNYLEATPLGVF